MITVNQLVKVIKTPRDLLNLMSYIRYGWIYNNKTYNVVGDNEFFMKNYRFFQPDEVLKYGVGTCYEQSLLEYVILSRLKYECKIVAIHQYYGSQHVFVLFKFNKKWFHFENANNPFRGIYGPFNSIHEASENVYKQIEAMNKVLKGHNTVEVHPNKLIGKKNLNIIKMFEITGFDQSRSG